MRSVSLSFRLHILPQDGRQRRLCFSEGALITDSAFGSVLGRLALQLSHYHYRQATNNSQNLLILTTVPNLVNLMTQRD